MLKIASSATKANQTSPSDAQCRERLKRALYCVSVACPPGLFAWLEETHPRFHAKVTADIPSAINASWGTSEFDTAIRNFLCALSCAIAAFRLAGKDDGRGTIES